MTPSLDFSTTVAGVRLPFAAMNASGTATRPEELRALAGSRTGAIVLSTTTVHPFVHPEFRALHNPGFDKLVPLARELVELERAPVIASIAGTSPDEYATLGRAFAEAGVAIIEANVADPYVATTASPFDEPGRLRELLGRLASETTVPVAVKVPNVFRIGLDELVAELSAIDLHVVVIKNDFTGFEKFLLEAGSGFEVITLGGVHSGYDVSRALHKGARAVQLGPESMREGVGIFGRLERDMRTARTDRRGN